MARYLEETVANPTAPSIFDKEAYLGFASFYNMFFGVGLALMLVIMGLIFFLGMKKFHKFNPVGILYHMLIVQLFMQFRIFLVGLFYQIWLVIYFPDHTYHRDFSFMREQIDGTEND